MTDKQIRDEQIMLDFAVKANIILWEGPHTESHRRLIEKLGPSEAKARTLLILFNAIKEAFRLIDVECEKELLSEA